MIEYVRVEDKAAGRWLVLLLSDLGNEIVATTKSKYHAQDLVLALNFWTKSQELNGNALTVTTEPS